ncbi:hypothetical protein Ddc_10325 [Ditylenchus destructor]|nr:hypothetical protein Ddc_10325 [Ditylenchus destructor]
MENQQDASNGKDSMEQKLQKEIHYQWITTMIAIFIFFLVCIIFFFGSRWWTLSGCKVLTTSNSTSYFVRCNRRWAWNP